MANDLGSTVSQLLEAHQAGDPTAAERLFQLVYEDLKKTAVLLMRKERLGHTLQPTALVHEAWIRVGSTLPDKSRAYFYTAFATAMKRILIEHARARAVRPERVKRVPLDAAMDALEQTHQCTFEVLVEPLEEFSRIYTRQHTVVMLRIYGYKFSEIAEQLGVSLGTVESDWRFARAWLLARVGGEL